MEVKTMSKKEMIGNFIKGNKSAIIDAVVGGVMVSVACYAGMNRGIKKTGREIAAAANDYNSKHNISARYRFYGNGIKGYTFEKVDS